MRPHTTSRNILIGLSFLVGGIFILVNCHKVPLWFKRRMKSMDNESFTPKCDYAPTVFTRIINRQEEDMPNIIYEDEMSMAFMSIHPVAPTQFLVIPKKQIPNLMCATEDDAQILGHLLLVVKKVASKFPELKKGYRVVINNGPQGLQAIYHTHIHVLGGRQMRWPPG